MFRVLLLLLPTLSLVVAHGALGQFTIVEPRLNVSITMSEWEKMRGVVLTTDVASDVRATVWTKAGDIVQSLDLLPVLHIVVDPIPPLDYVVLINGKRYPSTKESKYGVARGKPASLHVSRTKVKPCTWSGVVHKDETILCKL